MNSIELAKKVSEKAALVALKYATLKKKVAKLEADCQRLEEEKQQLEDKYTELSEQFNIYKMSMSLSNSTDATQARKYLDQMVREIDKCIALLNR